MKKADVIVIGAGAAGLMAAGEAALRGLAVLLLDKNERPARKVMITGKGRCNLTNYCEVPDFMRAVRSGSRFLYSSLSRFTPYDTMSFFEEQGVPLKVERGNRVFPQSDRAVDIVDALTRFVKKAGVHYQRAAAEELVIEEGKITGVMAEGKNYPCRAVIVATGGLSYPGTGSTGDGYRFAQRAGHTVRKPHPSLVPLEVKGRDCRDMQGLSLRNVVLSLKENEKGKVVFSELGEMLFTHFGVSGPLVLSASAHMGENPSAYRLHLDLKPALSCEQLDARVQRDFQKFSNKAFINSLSELLPT